MFSFLLAALLSCALSAVPDESWGYVTVRPDAHMFWWLYGMTNSSAREDAPLVVWLQGGPGASSTGFGNFLEIGPLDKDLKARPINWVQAANILFIDNPVGTGYSYVTSPNAYATSDAQIGKDLVALLKEFLRVNPTFQKNPFYIFCESYGGKMTTTFGVFLLEAIKGKEIVVNFKGVTLGDSWISPVSFTNAWADYLLFTSEIDNLGYKNITAAANILAEAVKKEEWTTATNLWGQLENLIGVLTDGINWYNILDRSGVDPEQGLNSLMNGLVRRKLGTIPTNVQWGSQSNAVFNAMAIAFMQEVVWGVDVLLEAGVNVAVYSGNLDLICCTTGTTAWMKQLRWTEMNNFWNAERQSVVVDKIVGGYKKQWKNLVFYNILAAGHMGPIDQPATAKAVLQDIIGVYGQ